MADKPSDANRLARDPQRRITAATAIGMNALKPIMHFQVSMLKMCADSIERPVTKREWKKPRPLSRNSQTRNAPRSRLRSATEPALGRNRALVDISPPRCASPTTAKDERQRGDPLGTASAFLSLLVRYPYGPL